MCWTSFVPVVKNFLNKKKAKNYRQLVEDILFNFNKPGFDMSVKIKILFVHSLHSDLDRFLDNLGDITEEQSKIFHQNI